MRQLWRGIREHRRSALMCLLVLLVLWVVTVITWDCGIPNPLALIHVFLWPFFVGWMTNSWKSNSGLAGLLAAELDLAFIVVLQIVLELVYEGVLMLSWEGALEALGFAVFFGIPGYLLALLGGTVGKAVRGGSASAAG